MYMNTVEVGELRQNLSRYLRRVERGERLVVTDRNRPVAELGPPVVAALLHGRSLRGHGHLLEVGVSTTRMAAQASDPVNRLPAMAETNPQTRYAPGSIPGSS